MKPNRPPLFPVVSTRPVAQAGLTLIELMISITLGLFVALAAVSLLVSSKSGYMHQDDTARMHDTARFAMEMIARTARQTSFVNWEPPTDSEERPVMFTTDDMTPNISGLDDLYFETISSEMENTKKSVSLGSDIIAFRYFGSGEPGKPDYTVLNCVGAPYSPPVNGNNAATGRGWSIFYVGMDKTDKDNPVPELRCKYKDDKNNTWKTEAIARGVESFQVLYGIDTDERYLDKDTKKKIIDPEAKIPNIFVNATTVTNMDAWKKVVALKVSMLIRGSEANRTDNLDKKYHLFDETYTNAIKGGVPDPGTYIEEKDIPIEVRNHPRKIFRSTIQLRNQMVEYVPYVQGAK